MVLTILTSGINVSQTNTVYARSSSLSKATLQRNKDVKTRAEKLLGKRLNEEPKENIFIFDENDRIINEIHTDGYRCTYTQDSNGDTLEHSYYDNIEIYHNKLGSNTAAPGPRISNADVEEKLAMSSTSFIADTNSRSAAKPTSSSYYVNGRRMNSIMTNQDILTMSMSASEIQSFLEKKKSILKNKISIYAKNSSGKVYDTGRDVKPSTVIYNSAKDHGINPKVLLVMLQREQGLVTSSTAKTNSRAMYFAMGYGATDSGDNVKYTGFDKQVEGAATLLKKLWIEAPASKTLSVNGGKSHTRGGITYPGSIVVDTFSAYALYKYCPWVFDTSITTSFSGGQYLFLSIYKGWWSSWS